MCPKKRFATEHAAGQALVSAKIRRYLHGNLKRREERAYHCVNCDGWHLTSMR